MRDRAGVADVGAGHVGMLRIELQRDEVAARRQRAREPDRAVAAERADLEDAPRAQHLREKMSSLP